MPPATPPQKSRPTPSLARPLIRRRIARRPVVEVLEQRSLLSGNGGTFASLFAETTPGQVAEFSVQLDRADFGMPQGQILLDIRARAAGPGASDPGSVQVAALSRGSARVVFRRSDTTGTPGSLTVARVTRGTFGLFVNAEGGSTGPCVVDLRLVGDVDGDFRVSRRDLAIIRALRGRAWGGPGYRSEADADGDGTIGPRDFALARSNLGASTRVRPLAVTAELERSSDTDGDRTVIHPDVVITGQAGPAARVRVEGTSGWTVTDARGRYRIPVHLGPTGETALRIEAVDRFGQRSEAPLVVTRRDVVLDWNALALDAIRADKTAPPRAARALAIVHAAIYDAVNAIDRTGETYRVAVSPQPGASAEAAATAAAHRALVALFPGQAANLDAAIAAALRQVPDGPGKDAGVALGRQVAEQILAWRADDGADKAVPYTPGSDPGQWVPTPPALAPALLPQWPALAPFAMTSGAAYRPVAPPVLDGPAYAANLSEVQALGRNDSPSRTAEQTQIALFWADGTGTVTPPGHWNEIAAGIVAQRGLPLTQTARTFALLNIALADAGILAWDAKYAFSVWRPITAIRQADADGNPLTTADPSWTPLLATPPFPSYMSGHSTFSGAASEVLAAVFGPDVPFTTGSDALPGVTRHFRSFAEAAEEAGRSRIYGGIHFEFDNRDGLAAGRALGRYVVGTFLKPATS